MNGPNRGDDSDDADRGDDSAVGIRSPSSNADSNERRSTTDAANSRAQTATTGAETRSPTEGGPPHDPDDDPSSSGSSPPSSPNAVRNWTILLVGLGLVSFFSAATTLLVHDAMVPTIGAAVLGFGLVGTALVAREAAPRTFRALSSAWSEHRLYVWFSGGLFVVGIAIGAALAAAGVDLTELLVEMLMEELEGEEFGGGEIDPTGLEGEHQLELSATFFILNNTPPFLVAIFGALTFGLLTFIIMLFNGVLVGNVSAVVGADAGYGLIVALLAPHGIFELTALFIAAGIGFRFLVRTAERLLGNRDALFTKAYLLRTSLFALFGWLMLVVAAFVEAYLTIPIVELFFPDV